jgi:Cu-Zn family superoxide dismutase
MVKSATIVAALLAVPAVALSACSANQKPSTSEGTTPSVWTGSPAPSGPASAAPAPATFEFSNGFATITVETTGSNILSPGFHGMHIHKVGKCEANSVAPTGGQPGNFLSAGAHFQVPGHENTHPASGDLSSLQVRGDRSAKLVTTTDAFTADQLLAGGGTAIIIHEKADNFANIPNRYTQGGTPGPDSETLATGDAGARVACGVITG